MTAGKLALALHKGTMGAREATLECLQAIERENPRLHAVLRTCREDALREADAAQQRLDNGRPLSALDGVPYVCKDNLSTKGVETTCASRMLQGYRPPFDATVVEQLRQGGAILVGKTNMDEFAMGSSSETGAFGAVRNPYNMTHSAGGSSGGSAAAVASGMACLALGTDTGGSIRQPAAHCGVTGFKPTYGALSRYGLIAYASGMDTVGPLARSAEDCALLFSVCAKHDPRDMTSRQLPPASCDATDTLRGLRIGLPNELYTPAMDDDVRQSVLTAAKTLETLGAIVQPCRLPHLSLAASTYYVLACAEASSNLARYDGIRYGFRAQDADDLQALYEKTRSSGFGTEVKRRIRLGAFVLSGGFYDAYYKKALAARALIRQDFDRALQESDLLLAPVTPTAAPPLGESQRDPWRTYDADLFTAPVNLAGLPALAMPCGQTAAGLPIGCQLIGRAMADWQLLAAGRVFQSHTRWHDAQPKKGADHVV